MHLSEDMKETVINKKNSSTSFILLYISLWKDMCELLNIYKNFKLYVYEYVSVCVC